MRWRRVATRRHPGIGTAQEQRRLMVLPNPQRATTRYFFSVTGWWAMGRESILIRCQVRPRRIWAIIRIELMR